MFNYILLQNKQNNVYFSKKYYRHAYQTYGFEIILFMIKYHDFCHSLYLYDLFAFESNLNKIGFALTQFQKMSKFQFLTNSFVSKKINSKFIRYGIILALFVILILQLDRQNLNMQTSENKVSEDNHLNKGFWILKKQEISCFQFFRVRLETQSRKFFLSDEVNKNKQKIRLLAGQSSYNPERLNEFILVLCIGVPGITLLAFIIFIGFYFLIKYCLRRKNDKHLEKEIDLKKFSIYKKGPLTIDSNQECPICLQKNVNIKTYCGHSYHAICLKSWCKKKTEDGKIPVCPSCQGAEINPIRVYCSKCFDRCKLDKLYSYSKKVKIEQISNFKCQKCREKKVQISKQMKVGRLKNEEITNLGSTVQLQKSVNL